MLAVAPILSVALASPALRTAWERGDGASSLRPLVTAASSAPSARAAAAAVCSSTAAWEGLWVARIEHFEKVQWSGLRVRPHYDLAADGGIVSHVHVAIGPVKGWLSASGFMSPATDGSAEVRLVFDDFWVGADSETPRNAPSPNEESTFDAFTRWLGRASFFEGLAAFPVDYYDDGLCAFRFTPLNSCIVAERAAAGEAPQRCSTS